MLKPSNDKTKIDLLANKIPKVIVSKNALKKMKIYIDECDKEIGWLGTAYKHGNIYLIDDVLLFDQDVHATTTEITPEGLSEFGEGILQQEDGVDLWNSIKVWGHSHVNMSVFSSGQDDKQMEVFSDCGHDFFIRIIGNKKNDMRVDLYDFESGVIYNYIPWVIARDVEEVEIERTINALEEQIELLQLKLAEQMEIPKKMKEEIKVEIKDKVTTMVTTFYGNTKGNLKTYGDKSWNERNKSKKKEEIKETKKGSENEGIVVSMFDDEEYTYGQVIIYDEEVLDQYVVAEISEAFTVKEVREILDNYGYDSRIYNDSEILGLMDMAQKSVFDAYSYQFDENSYYNGIK